MIGALVLVRWEAEGVRKTTLQASTSLYELLDELQRVAFRVFSLGEGDTIEAEAQHA